MIKTTVIATVSNTPKWMYCPLLVISRHVMMKQQTNVMTYLMLRFKICSIPILRKYSIGGNTNVVINTLSERIIIADFVP